jgi:aldehyde:ferredoxin oxidoreductase
MLARSISNSACVCIFMPYSSDQMADHVKAVTGWNITHWELLKATERALNMARAFNAREGFRADADMLPDRFFEPLEGGALEGQSIDRQQFLETRGLAYDMLGWDRQTGWPKRWKLYELGLDWLVEELEKHGCPID